MGAEQAVIEGYVSAAPRIRDVAWSQIRYDVDAVRQIGAPAATCGNTRAAGSS